MSSLASEIAWCPVRAKPLPKQIRMHFQIDSEALAFLYGENNQFPPRKMHLRCLWFWFKAKVLDWYLDFLCTVGNQQGISPWWPLLGLLPWCPIFNSSHCNSFEDQATLEFIYGCLIFRWVAATFTTWQGTGIVVQAMATRWHVPFIRYTHNLSDIYAGNLGKGTGFSHILSNSQGLQWNLPKQTTSQSGLKWEVVSHKGLITMICKTYYQISNIRCTLVGNQLVDLSDVVGASPVGAAPTTSSFLS